MQQTCPIGSAVILCSSPCSLLPLLQVFRCAQRIVELMPGICWTVPGMDYSQLQLRGTDLLAFGDVEPVSMVPIMHPDNMFRASSGRESCRDKAGWAADAAVSAFLPPHDICNLPPAFLQTLSHS